MGEARDVVDRYLDIIRTKDIDSARSLLDDDYTYMDGSGEIRRGTEAAIEVFESYLGAFPDLSSEVVNQFEFGDNCCTEFIVRGTHTGELQGIPPTGKHVEMRVCNICQVRAGKIVAEREYFDNLSMMTQLGVVPEQAPA